MANQFSPKVSQILAFSKEEAIRLCSSHVGPEHLLLGILRDKDNNIQTMLRQMGVDNYDIKNDLEAILETDRTSAANEDVMLDEKANKLLKQAVFEARMQSVNTVGEDHLLLAILHNDHSSNAKDILENNNINYGKVLAYVMKRNDYAKNNMDYSEDEDYDIFADDHDDRLKSSKTTTTQSRKKSSNRAIDVFGTDLTDAARSGKLDTIVGREAEITRIMEILCRRKKNNPVLIGEPGVGKSAIVEGLALLIARNQTSPILFNKRIVSLDMTSVVAGTKYRGQFEERIKKIINELEEDKNIIVFIDEIHTLVGAGATPGSMDAANILKPALARGAIQCIGATTFDEYRNSIEKDGALERRFQKVVVEPTSKEETLVILNNIKDRYEEHHKVTYTDKAIEACVKMTGRFITERQFPDKAIDALDETGAHVHLRNIQIPPEFKSLETEIETAKRNKQKAVAEQDFEKAATYRDRQCLCEEKLREMKQELLKSDSNIVTVTAGDVAHVVARMTGIPVQQVEEAEGIRLKGMHGHLSKYVIGQDDAVTKVTKAIQRNRIGMKNPNRPIAAFMFLGPTGTGKTYLAKQLARFIFGTEDAIIRIDMSEYSESFNTSRLVGAPPGYVGYEEGGQLTEKVRRHPYSIVLLDEIEKAHGNIFNMLLQVLDEGRLTDGYGRIVDFRNTIIIMTSNVGSKEVKDFGRSIGFSSVSGTDSDSRRMEGIIRKSLSKQFSPEFLNRMDEIITFGQLDIEDTKTIVGLEMTELLSRLGEMGYTISITDKAKEHIARSGYDQQYGARPLKRAIQNLVEDKLCDMILNGEIAPGSNITIGKSPNKEELTFKVNE